MSAQLLFFAGSARKDSVNKKLATTASEMAKEAGAEVTFIDLADYDMPIYNQDFQDEHGLPENAKKVKHLFMKCDGFCIASPEYNSTITPLLKNTLDWISRQEKGDDAPLVAFKGKTALLVAASPGKLGGIRALKDVRTMISSIGTLVVPQQLAISDAYNKFDDEGKMKDCEDKDNLRKTVQAFVETASALKK
jgi:NAD(P)H-dependent FMN reductase